MAVKRIWFPNAPSGIINTAQQYQIGVGYPFGLEISESIDENIEYYRRYLNDPVKMIKPVPAGHFEDDVESEYSKYFRRYLNDPRK